MRQTQPITGGPMCGGGSGRGFAGQPATSCSGRTLSRTQISPFTRLVRAALPTSCFEKFLERKLSHSPTHSPTTLPFPQPPIHNSPPPPNLSILPPQHNALPPFPFSFHNSHTTGAFHESPFPNFTLQWSSCYLLCCIEATSLLCGVVGLWHWRCGGGAGGGDWGCGGCAGQGLRQYGRLEASSCRADMTS